MIDGIIRRWRPGIASLVLDADPVAYFTPQEVSDFEPARLVEPFFTWYFREHMDTTFEIMYLIDLIASRGHAYAREGWEFRTDKEARIVQVRELFPNLQEIMGMEDPSSAILQVLIDEYQLNPQDPIEGPQLQAAVQGVLQGREYVRLLYRSITNDRASWKALDPVNVIVPPDDDPEDAEFFAIIHFFSPEELAQMAGDGIFSPQVVSEVIEQSGSTEKGIQTSGSSTTDDLRDQIRDVLNRKAGLDRNTSRPRSKKKIPVWEIYCRLNLSEARLQERVVVWYAADQDLTLSTMEYPLPFKTWPVTPFYFNADGPRPIDNRGVAEMLLPLQKVVNALHNARLDAAQIVLAPVLKMRNIGGNYRQSINWAPGSIIPVQNVEDLQPVIHDIRILAALLQEEQSNQRLAETYVGTFDATITNLMQPRERRTAAEVQTITQISGNIFGLDAKLFQAQMSKSMNKIWQLYEEFGQAELFFRVQGEEKPRLARKADLTKNFDIRASGTPATTNRSFVLQNIERVLPILLNPTVLSSGRVDLGELITYWVSLLDFQLAKKVIRSPEEAAAVQQILQAAQLSAEQTGQSPPGPF